MKQTKKTKIFYIITYIILFLLNLFFIINTIWISLNQAADQEAKILFISGFFQTLLIDFFLKEILILIIKASLYFLLIEKEDNEPCWKRFLMVLMSLGFK